MQGEGSTMNSLSETSDIGHGSVSNSNIMSHQPMPRNLLHPVESRLSNYVISSGETTRINSTNHDAQSFNNRSFGEPSSGLNLQNEVNDDRMNMDVCSSPFSNCPGAGSRLEERQFEPINNLFPQRDDIVSSDTQNQVRSGFFSLQGSISNDIPQNESPNPGAVIGPNFSMSSGLNIERTYSSGALSDKPGTSSDYMEETDGGSSSSFDVWGLSCKRKSLEGTSRQAYPGASSSSFPQPENDAWHAGSSYGPSSLSLSTSTHTSPSVDPPQQQNLRRGIPSDAFPSSSVTENPGSIPRNLGQRANLWSPQEPLPFSILSAGSSRHRLSGPVHFTDSVDLRSTETLASNLRTSSGESHTMQAPCSSRNIHPSSWDGASTSRVGNISSSSLPGGRSSAIQEDFIIRSALRNSGENSPFLPCAEMRNATQNPTTWNLSSGNTGPSSDTHSLPNPAQIPQHNPQAENQQRASEYAPWSLFPSAESESGVHTGHFYPLPSGPSQDTSVLSGPNRRGNHQPHSRSSFFAEGLSDDAFETPPALQAFYRARLGDDPLGAPHSLRALAADIEGRRRLISEIRQVLTAMRWRFEDDDPIVYHGMAEIHDRHRDMRLDVDNMSYEELLALEERIGDVSTGLSEDAILKVMKQRKHSSILLELPPDLEPCCICQAEYADADDIGTLDCGHDFHTNCIKQWLLQKNLCPICKTTGLLPDGR